MTLTKKEAFLLSKFSDSKLVYLVWKKKKFDMPAMVLGLLKKIFIFKGMKLYILLKEKTFSALL